MVKYESLSHTADAKFRAYGKTREEQFSNAALAMFAIMIDSEKVEAKVERTVSVEGDDEKALLYNWLEELLVLLDSEFFMLREVKDLRITKNEKFKLEATVVGDAEEGKYVVSGGVKAPTYAEMTITDEFVQVVVDI